MGRRPTAAGTAKGEPEKWEMQVNVKQAFSLNYRLFILCYLFQVRWLFFLKSLTQRILTIKLEIRVLISVDTLQ